MSTLVCPKCTYENIVLTCGFCLQCGNDLTDVMPADPAALETTSSENQKQPAPQQAASLESRLREALLLLGASLEISKHGWTSQLATNERHQRVHIMESQEGDAVSFLSICGPVDPHNAMALLECNSRLKTCAFAVRKINGEPMFVVTANYPVDALSADEIARTINEVVLYADRVEAQVAEGRDTY